jgi:hypothetical protein
MGFNLGVRIKEVILYTRLMLCILELVGAGLDTFNMIYQEWLRFVSYMQQLYPLISVRVKLCRALSRSLL